MLKSSKLLSRPFITAFVFFALAASLVTMVVIIEIRSNERDLEAQVLKKAVDKKIQIEHSLNARINYDQALASLIELYPNISDSDFGKYVNSLRDKDTVILTMSCAKGKGYNIDHIYPLQGHEQALGASLIEQSHHHEKLMEKIKKDHMAVEGPRDLIEGGGKGLIFYAPIMIKNPKTKLTQMFGTADIVIS
jgi:sensor domain CHASE-containing protein